MEMMSPDMMHGMSIGMIVVWTALLVLLGLFVWLIIFFSRRAETGDLLVADLAGRRGDVELEKFFEDPGAAWPTWPLAGGLHAPGFSVASLEAAMAALPAAEYGAIAELGGQRAVTGVAPGGVRFELWQD